MEDSFYSKDELKKIGFKYCGNQVKISRLASFYSPEKIEIGDYSRVDDFCILSGKIKIGNHVHISAGAYLYAGDAGIEMCDFSSISSRSAIYAISDDYSGKNLTNPTVDKNSRGVISKKVIVGKYTVIGTGSSILPGVTISEGCSIGAMSLVNKDTKPWGIYVGIPCKRIKERSMELLKLL